MDLIPVACLIEAGEARERWQDWQSLTKSRRQEEPSDRGFRLHFLADDATRATLARLVVTERQCCGFVDWKLEDLGDELVVAISGDPIGVGAMLEAFGLTT